MNEPVAPAGRAPADPYTRLATARGVEFHLNPRDVRFARRLYAVLLPTVCLVPTGPLFALVGFVGYDLTGGRWWGLVPAGASLGAFVVLVGRWAVRWAGREGRKILLVAPDGRIAFNGETLLPPGRAVAVRVERFEGQEDGPVVSFQVVAYAPGERVPLPVPGAGSWSTAAQHWRDWTFGFDAPEPANRFAAEIGAALGAGCPSVTLYTFGTNTDDPGAP